MDSRIRVFTGHFGSGKTELALNYALKLNDNGRKVCIVDIDVVNPYFSTRDEKELLEARGIKVIAMPKEMANAELGVVPLNTLAAFNDKSYDVVIDVGGDEQGAVALGQYNRFFREEDYDMYFVINTNRPFTKNADEVIEYMKEIERASRLKVKYLISNTNMSYETTIEDVLKGQEIVKEVSDRTGLPVRYTVVGEELFPDLPEGMLGEVFPIKLFMLPPWRKDIV